MSDASENNQSEKNNGSENEPERMALTSEDVAAAKRDELIAALKTVMPGAVTEGRVDLKQIAAELGDDATVTEKERFGLQWPGRAECMKIIQRPSTGTLKPDVNESADFENTENLFIEGDNLEVLKLLQTAYHNRIKMIYIDPPYNTGNEFIYPDKFSETLKTYLDYTGQLDEDGNPFRSKTKEERNVDRSGSFHSTWLNMMYPRLYLARTLLKDDGVIFISIDDHEQANLKSLCDLVFGEENFVGQFAVQLNPRGRHLDKFIAQTHEYILAYAKDIQQSGVMFKLPKEGKMLDEYSKSDDLGKFRELELRNRNPAFNSTTRPNLYYPLYTNDDDYSVSLEKTSSHPIEVFPTNSEGGESCWTWGREKVSSSKSLLTSRQTGSGTWRIFRKDYLVKDGEVTGTLPKSLWQESEINNDLGKKSIQGLFTKTVMDFPKSPFLIRKLLRIGCQEDDIVLDYFSGSGTTAHAVMDLNAEDGGNRKFICVQLPEQCDEKSEAFKVGFKTIADIGKERIRRAGAKIKEAIEAKTQGALPGFDDGGANTDIDVGFKVFKLDKSTMLPWNMTVDEFDESGEQLEQHVLHLDGQAREQDILYELLLKSGYPLETKVEVVEMAGKEVHSVMDGALLICLDKELTTEVIDAMAAADPLEVICLDEGFQNNDQLKTNAVQAFKSRARSKETQIVFKTV